MCDHSMWALYMWPLYAHSIYEHSMCDHSMWTLYMGALYMWALYVWPLYVSTLCVTTLCETILWVHSMGALYVRPLYVSTLCGSTLYVSTLCEQSMWALYVSTLWEHSMCDHSMLSLYVSTLCVTTLCEHSMCDRSMWTLYMGALYMWALYVWPLYVSTLCVTTLWEHSMCEHSMCDHSIWAHRKVRKLQGKMNSSSWTGCCRTPKSTKITRKNEHQFLGRMLQRQKRQKNLSFIVKTPVKSIGEHRKVRELPRKMNIEEVEEAKKYENLQTKPVLDPFKSTADTRKVRELPRKMKSEEVEEPETMKIYRQKPRAPVWATRKLRKFTDETNMQARNHENSDEICAQPVRHLDLATPAFTTTVRTPSVTTLFGEILHTSCFVQPGIVAKYYKVLRIIYNNMQQHMATHNCLSLSLSLTLGREPGRKVGRYKQPVRRVRRLCIKFDELVRPHHPPVSICSHLIPITPMLQSRNLFKFGRPIHCWTSRRSSSRRLPM